MSLTIDDLLNSLQDPNKKKKLENNRDTWSRIGSGDDFKELGLEPSELESFLTEWCSENPYLNL